MMSYGLNRAIWFVNINKGIHCSNKRHRAKFLP